MVIIVLVLTSVILNEHLRKIMINGTFRTGRVVGRGGRQGEVGGNGEGGGLGLPPINSFFGTYRNGFEVELQNLGRSNHHLNCFVYDLFAWNSGLSNHTDLDYLEGVVAGILVHVWAT